EKRNILGVIEKAGIQIAKEVIKHRAYGQKITEILGGKATHPVSACIPGGFARPISKEEQREIEEMVKSCLKFAEFSLKIFDEIVLKNTSYIELMKSQSYTLKTYYMGLVDKDNKVNFYDGKVRVVDPYGNEFVKFSPEEYLGVIEEHVEPWTYVKFPYLKKIGWRGLIDGPDSGIYRVGPLGRLNAADGMATPLAQEEYKRMYETLGGKPVHNTLAYHWARLIELLYAAERALELVTDPEITSTNLRNKPGEPGEGVGIVEAARGTLIHHYQLDENALARKVNLIVATVNNAPSICMSIRNAAKGLIRKGNVTDGILNMIEMAFRAYDPCFACATHYAIGQMPLEVEIYNSEKQLIKVIRRNIDGRN
ncbi:MAG: Ni/Fe hydrogenase subunit alpha, partial [Candidatus Bathyarchaeia archaeon]